MFTGLPNLSLMSSALRRGGGAAWSPESLFASGETGEAIDFSDLTRIWQDSAKTTPGAVDQAIGRIDGLSPNGHYASASGSARPLLKQTGSDVYGLGDGLDDSLVFDAPLIPSGGPFSVMFRASLPASGFGGGILSQYVTSQNGRTVLMMNQNSAGTTSLGSLRSFSSNVTAGAGSGGQPLAVSPGVSTSFTYELISEGTGAEQTSVHLNGAEIDRFTLPVILTSTNTALFGLSGFFGGAGRVDRLIIINRLLSTAERAQALAWLAA